MARRRRHPGTQEKLMIWLVDYTSYRKDIDPELARLRRDFDHNCLCATLELPAR